MTGLPWVSDINSKRLDYELTTLASGRLNLYSEEAMKERPLKKFWRSYMSFEPGELEQFRVFVNRNPSYKSIRAVRLRGTKRMGLITMGQWPHGKDVSAIVKRDHKMNIQGEISNNSPFQRIAHNMQANLEKGLLL